MSSGKDVTLNLLVAPSSSPWPSAMSWLAAWNILDSTAFTMSSSASSNTFSISVAVETFSFWGWESARDFCDADECQEEDCNFVHLLIIRFCKSDLNRNELKTVILDHAIALWNLNYRYLIKRKIIFCV